MCRFLVKQYWIPVPIKLEEESQVVTQREAPSASDPLGNTHSVKLRIRQFFQMTRVRRSSRTVKNLGWRSSDAESICASRVSPGYMSSCRQTPFLTVTSCRLLLARDIWLVASSQRGDSGNIDA